MESIKYILGIAFILTGLNAGAYNKAGNGTKGDNDKVKVIINTKGDEIIVDSYVTADPFSSYRINYKGTIVVSDNDKDIKSISPGGYLHIEKTAFGNDRAIKIISDEYGKLTKKYYEGKIEVPFNPKGKEWLAEILIEVIRSSGVGAESRLVRIYNQKGLDALLDEISEISNTYTHETKVLFIEIDIYQHSNKSIRNLYYYILADKIQLKEHEIYKVIDKIEQISSNSTKGTLLRELLYKYTLSPRNMVNLLEATATLDYNTERGSILRVINPKLSNGPDIVDAYFDVLNEMEINSEKGSVIKNLLKTNKNLNTQTYLKLLDCISQFSSEREKGNLLIRLTTVMPDNSEVIRKFYDVMNQIDSEYYVLKGEILTAISERGIQYQYKKDKYIALGMLEGSKNLVSNSQRGLNMRKVNRIFIDDSEVLDEYFMVLEEFSNKHEESNVILDLISKNKLSDRVLVHIYRRIDDYSSSYHHIAASILRASIDQLTPNGRAFEYFFDVLDNFDFDGTIEEILRLLCQQKDLVQNKDILARIIEASELINVDIEIASTLLNVAKVMPEDNTELRYVYKSAAKRLKSEYYFNKVMTAL